MSKVRSALVIGGGIAGPVTAIALQKAGIEATVYEAYSDTADGIGGGLAIAPNGVAALGVIGAEHAVLDHAQPVPAMAMWVNDKKIADMSGLAGLPPLQLVQRGDLYRALREHALTRGVRTEYGKRLVSAQSTATGVLSRFADGTEATADVLVGADGIHSKVRTLVDPNAPGPHYTGLLGFGAEVDVDVPAEPGTMNFAFGKRAYYLYGVNAAGVATWGANLPHPELSLSEAKRIPAEQWLARLREVYADDHPGGDMIRATSPENLEANGAIYIMPSVPHWHRDRMVLVGDAVHAPSNSSGQGGSQAIESGVQLARCLRDLPDAPSAFAAYERLRRDRVEAIAARAAKANRLKAPGAVTRMIMPLLMKVMLKAVMNPEKTLGHEQRFVIDWGAPVEPVALAS